MIAKKLTLAAALLAVSTLTGYAQTNSSNPTQAPSLGAGESPGGTGRTDNPGPTANMPGKTAPPTAEENSSHPSQAPTTGETHHQDLRPGTAGEVPSTGKPVSGSTNSKTPTR